MLNGLSAPPQTDRTWSKVISSEILTRNWKNFAPDHPGPGDFKKCLRERVPVYIPAFTDSEMNSGCLNLGHGPGRKTNPPASSQDQSDFERWNQLRQHRPIFQSVLDLNSYAEKLLTAKRLGIFTIEGRGAEWAQWVPLY